MAKHPIYIIFIYSLVLLASGSCIERIDFEVERKPGQLIVDGGLTNDGENQTIILSKTAESARIPIPIEDAQITLFDDQGIFAAYYPDRDNPGTYVLGGNNIDVEIGGSYFIEIELSDGTKYRSIPETMPEHKASLELITYNFTREQEVSANSIISEINYINTFIDVDLGAVEEPTYLRWDVEEVYKLTPTDFPDPFGNIPPPCYVYVYTSDIDLNLFSTLGVDIPRLSKLKVAKQRLGWQFREKHFFTVTQHSLTREAYEYWEKASDLFSSAGTIFDVPPAPLPGNIYNINDDTEEILGYFSVSSTSLIRYNTFRDDIPFDQILECTYSQFKRFSDYPDYCLNCISVRNSTYLRPSFF